MQAIHVKYLYPTNTRGTRIKATCAGVSVTIPYPYELSGMDVYREAAQTLCNKLGWIAPTYPRIVGGKLPDGSYSFVFVTADQE